IVAVADTHLFHSELRVPDGDVFVHAGDLCQAGHLGELEVAAEWIRSLPHKHKVVVAGNHDFAFFDFPGKAQRLFAFCTHLEDTGATIDGVSFWGSPWEPEFNDWAFNLPRGAALAEKWAQIPTSGRLGCADLLARIDIVKPKLHLFGHIHQDGGVW